MKLHEIGPKIKELRKKKKMTQQHLAKQAGISRVTLGKIERGELGVVSLKVVDTILFNLGFEIDFQTISGFGLPTLDTYE